jgi:SAM-dependent methyltransferase
LLDKIYRARFDEPTVAAKRELWGVLVREFLQGYVPVDARVADFGGGYCEFINAVRCRRKYVVDLNPDVQSYADPDVEILISDASDVSALPDGSIDVAFASNFFEHLPSKAELTATLDECRRVTRPGGLLVVLMPNIRYLGGRYWDYLDHHLPLTHLSLAEAVALSGYEVVQQVPRFLPYTVKQARFVIRPSMVSAYLRVRPAWRLVGRQMLVVARTP